MRIILGSESPRRKEILNYFSINFSQHPSHFDEESIPYPGKPENYALELAHAKGQVLKKQFPEDIIITADTVVYSQNELFGKPKDHEDAFRMLKKLCGEWQEVYTGVVVTYGEHFFQDYEMTKVLLNNFQDHEIHTYIERSHSYDKAAGYTIQGQGSVIVRRMEGCFYNVLGLPINTLRDLLLNVGVNLWLS